MKIDVHWHCVPARYVADLRAGRGNWPDRIVRGERDREFLAREGSGQVLFPQHYEPDLIRQGLERRRLDMALVSPAPSLFHYELEPAQTERVAATINEGIADLCRSYPQQFLGLATVPMQDPPRAIAELERAMTQLGLRGVEIGTNVNGLNLDEPQFFPFFERAAALQAFIFVHPANTVGQERTRRYYLSNLLGNPTDSGIAIASVIFGGVLERLPNLRLCFAHGGGIAPYIIGRWEHGYKVRPEAQAAIPKPPLEYFRLVYCDCLTHSDAALRYLVDLIGADHVLLGSDYPYDMGDEDPVGIIEAAAGLDEAAKRRILGDNVARLLGLEPVDAHPAS